jgi:ABC-type uncharacterized transport system substrate-binding protein
MRRRDFLKVIGGAAATWPLKRRAFLHLAAFALAWPGVSLAQQADRVRRIAVVMEIDADDPVAQRRTQTLVHALTQLGWMEGRNLRIDYRWGAGNPGRIHNLVSEAIGSAPEVIFTAGTAVLQEVVPATKSIPVVFVLVSDPVALGFVESLAHPGGNVTGFAVFEPDIGGKWLSLLKETTPAVTQASFLFNPVTAPIGRSLSRALVADAAGFGMTATAAPVTTEAEIEAAIVAAAKEPGGAVVIAPDAFTYVHRDEIVALVARHRLPAIYPSRDFVKAGGLMSYGVDLLAPFGQAALYLDRILKGVKPADLPVQDPTKFDFVVNLKTAADLGLVIAPSLLARADEVIE